ncbi:MAG: Type 1 glutamine amidotransferase-like domain-containing protein [bacterium]
MGKIIALGGGEIGRPGTKVETMSIDKEIIKLSGKKNPLLLFIPTASGDSESYYEVVKKHFGVRLKCRTDVLYLIKEKNSKEDIRKKILKADIIYVGGGNTLKMMKVWRKLGLDKILEEAYKNNIVLSGISAGAICWFKYGNSDSLVFSNKNAGMIRVKGLDFVDGLFCPHYDIEKKRKSELKRVMKNTKGFALALDNCMAIEIVDDKFRFISSKSTANAYITHWENGKYIETVIKKKPFSPVSTLFVQ